MDRPGQLCDGKGYGQSCKKEGKAEDKVINKDEKYLVFIPGESDEVEREGIAEEEAGENEKGIKERSQAEEIFQVC